MSAVDKELVVIGVPIYKPELTTNEKNSLLRLFSILDTFPICLFSYRELNINAYRNLLEGKQYTITYFDKKYFANINGYNSLLCSKLFYQKFDCFQYLLIYQLDAWVFRNELTYWCNLDYDYIGAPWFTSFNQRDSLKHFYGIGNGGFSLRRISAHLKALNEFHYLVPFKTVIRDFLKNRIGRTAIKELFLNLTLKNNTYYLLRPANDLTYEDMFWGLVIKRGLKWFRAPDMITASRFSLETNSQMLYEQNGNYIPFGCHAWTVYEPDFWQKHIYIGQSI